MKKLPLASAHDIFNVGSNPSSRDLLAGSRKPANSVDPANKSQDDVVGKVFCRVQRPLIFLLVICFIPTYSFALGLPLFEVYAPKFKGGLKFSLAALWSKPDLPQLDYAINIDDITIPILPSNTRQLQILSPHNQWNYEFGIGYDFPCTGNDLRINFSRVTNYSADRKEAGSGLESTLVDFISPLLIDTINVFSPEGLFLGNFTATGDLLSPDDIDFIQADTTFAINQLDLEASQSIHITPYFRLRWVGGIRAVKLEHDFNSLVVTETGENLLTSLEGLTPSETLFGPLPFSEIIPILQANSRHERGITEQSHYSGIGPRFGLDANYYLDIGVSFFASASAAALVGNSNSQATEAVRFHFVGETAENFFIDADPTVIFISSILPGSSLAQDFALEQITSRPNTTRIVPNLETKLGITYTPCLPCTCSQVFIELGYMTNHYYNAVDKMTFRTEDLGVATRTLDLSVDGFYLKVEMHV